jgi:DNA-binding response OmpR family regulator
MEKNLEIIIVDDDKDDQDFLIQAIHQIDTSYEIISLYDGTMLMDYLEINYNGTSSKIPHLIILDLEMPKMDGYEVLKRVRSKQHLKDIKIFVLTTCTYEYDRIKSIAYGCNDFYSKPTDPGQLKSIMEDIFSQMNSPFINTSVLS